MNHDYEKISDEASVSFKILRVFDASGENSSVQSEALPGESVSNCIPQKSTADRIPSISSLNEQTESTSFSSSTWDHREAHLDTNPEFVSQREGKGKSTTTRSSDVKLTKPSQQHAGVKVWETNSKMGGSQVLSEAWQTLSFGDDVIDVLERSRSDWNMMVERMSSETESISFNPFSKDAPTLSPHSKDVAKLDRRSEEREFKMEQATEKGEVESPSHDEAFVPIRKYSFKVEDVDIPLREQNLRQGINRRIRHESERASHEGDQESAFQQGVGGIRDILGSFSQGVAKLTPHSYLPQCACPSNAFDVVDCVKIDLDADFHQSMAAAKSPLNQSWFSIQDSDSISKLTNPPDLSALNSTFNGLNLSLDLTEILKIDDHTSHAYDF